MTGAYYNEIDPYAAQWLRNLIAAGHIAPGDVDERSIVDVQADDLKGYTQCHFFAGIGGWSYGLRIAGWPDDRPVWTGSCPCQPYSVASVAHGGAKGQGDDRHLWPVWWPLIQEHRPATVFGEQVKSAIEWGWWDEVCRDFEADLYACAAVVIPASAVKADHERARLYWFADAGCEGREGYQPRYDLLVATAPSLTKLGDPFARARSALGGDYSGLCTRDGVSVGMERCATHGYGNAIVPQVAAEVIGAYMEIAP